MTPKEAMRLGRSARAAEDRGDADAADAFEARVLAAAEHCRTRANADLLRSSYLQGRRP